MNRHTILTSLAALALAFSVQCLSAADVPAKANSVPSAATVLEPQGKTLLMADDAEGAGALAPFNPEPKRLWMGNWQKTSQTLAWKVSAPEEADYEVALISKDVPGVSLTGGLGEILSTEIKTGRWSRNTLGTVRLKKGEATLTLNLSRDLDPKGEGGQLRSLDLLPVAAKADYQKRVAASRASAAWMRGPGYGVMLQYGGWGYPKEGEKKPWKEVVNAFDVEKFAKMVDEDMGARWVIWSITWRDSHFPMPLKSVDAIVPEHTTNRDLLADLAAALNKRGIKLMFYYHPGHEDRAWWAANWKDGHDKDRFLKNWTAVVSEIGTRYGDRLAGWFFDDGCVYSPAPFEAMTQAAKTGFPGRLVSYNPWVLPSYTDFEDIQMGEGFTGDTSTAIGSDGIYPSGPHAGLQAHGMFCVDGNDWGIWKPNQPAPLKINAEKATSIVKMANEHGQIMSLNFNMYEDGQVTPETLDMFRQLKAAIYTKSK